MELKLGFSRIPCEDCNLLIVPYGIETTDKTRQAAIIILLIVPYGIET